MVVLGDKLGAEVASTASRRAGVSAEGSEAFWTFDSVGGIGDHADGGMSAERTIDGTGGERGISGDHTVATGVGLGESRGRAIESRMAGEGCSL